MDFETDTAHDQAIHDNIDTGVHQTNASVAENYSSGNAAARGLLNAPVQTNSNLAYGDQAMSRAIQSKYMNQFNRDQNQLNTSIMKNASADHIRNLQVATQSASQEVEMNKQKQLLAFKIREANRRARGSIIGNTLGIVGTVAGAVVGGMYSGGLGTTAGAAAGGAAGNALGSGIGRMIGEG